MLRNKFWMHNERNREFPGQDGNLRPWDTGTKSP